MYIIKTRFYYYPFQSFLLLLFFSFTFFSVPFLSLPAEERSGRSLYPFTYLFVLSFYLRARCSIFVFLFVVLYFLLFVFVFRLALWPSPFTVPFRPLFCSITRFALSLSLFRPPGSLSLDINFYVFIWKSYYYYTYYCEVPLFSLHFFFLLFSGIVS